METFAQRFSKALKMRKMKQSEIAEILGVNEGTISNYVKGTYAPKQRRTEQIANILQVNIAWLLGADVSPSPIKSTLVANSSVLCRVPIYSSVSAGFGALAIDEVVDYIELPFSSLAEAEETLCVTVHGDSMSPKIQDGDLIQIHKQDSVDSGDITAVLLDGDDGLVKKVTYGADWIKLTSLNQAYSPIVLNGAEVLRCKIVGKVKRIIRDV